MDISLWSVPLSGRPGERIFALVPCTDHHPERRLEADDPVWRSKDRKCHWAKYVDWHATRLKPANRIKFWVSPGWHS